LSSPSSTSEPSPGSSAAIEVAGLTKRYRGKAVVDDLSFQVRAGAVTGFLGPNGAGKTTTLRMLLGLARPTDGDATIFGRGYHDLDDPAKTVGASLEISGFHPGRSGRNHLRSLAELAGLPGSRVQEVLKLVELTEAADRRAGKYSMGMRQRLALAATLLGDPQLLVLDEPANGLDPQGIRWLRDFLRERASEGRTVLISSHVLAEVAQTVDDVVVIHRGRLVDEGPVSRLTAPQGVGVRSPRSTELAQALRGAGAQVNQEGERELLISGMDAAEVGELAFAAQIPLHELSPRGASLEDIFLELTGDGPAPGEGKDRTQTGAS
jgi:ABC-2 type transport system ATP-binding protein